MGQEQPKTSVILMVDDTSGSLRYLAMALESAGYLTLPAASGSEALEIIQTAMPDLVLLDILMPGIDGFEVCRRIKEDPACSTLPVIFMSASLDPDIRIRGLAQGAVDFISKPVQKEELLARVRIHLELALLNRTLAEKNQELEQINRCLANDLHERTRMAELEHERSKLLRIVELSLNECYVFDSETLRFQYVNPSALRNLGYGRATMLGMTPLDLKPEVSVEQFEALLAPLRSGEITLQRFETVHRRADGSCYPVDIQLQLVELDGERFFLAMIEDITRRREDERRVMEMQAQMLQQDKLASIGQLAAGVAHEINNPVGFISSNLVTMKTYAEKFVGYIGMLEGQLQAASGELPGELAAERQRLKLGYIVSDIGQLLTESIEGAERVKKIVQDLKTFARVDAAYIGDVDLNRCLDSTINIVWNEIKYAAELKRDYGTLPQVPCNAQQINQVFLNLLINAVHAIQVKGDLPGLITVSTRQEEGAVVISIADSGCGIAPQYRSSIFTPFFTTKEVGRGTGLGLAISAEIIRKHGGMISFESEEGTGTTFRISLPLKQHDSTSPEEG